MSFKVAIPHLEQALSHANAGNAAKAMHHIGHAMLHLRGMTTGAGGASKLPQGAQADDAAANDDAGAMEPNAESPRAPAPAVGSLRAKLAGMTQGMNTGKGGY